MKNETQKASVACIEWHQRHLFIKDVMDRFRGAVAFIGHIEDSSALGTTALVCGSGFVLEGQFLITASVVHDSLTWQDTERLFAAVRDPSGALKYSHIQFIDCDSARGIAVYRLRHAIPATLHFADIDFESDISAGLDMLMLSYCSANESLRCERTPALMAGQVFIKSGQNDRSVSSEQAYAIVEASVNEQEYGSPLFHLRAPPKLSGLIGGSLEYAYRDFIMIEENPGIGIAWSLAGFNHSSLYTHMEEEFETNAAIINDAAAAPYGTPHATPGAEDEEAFGEDLEDFMAHQDADPSDAAEFDHLEDEE